MALFDSIIKEASEKYNLGDKSGTLLSSLLALITNQETGGFAGFISRFREAGLGDTATSWITTGDNAEISNEQMESAIGEDTIAVISEKTGIEKEKATSAMAFMTPKVVDKLTPKGEVPDDDSILSTIGGYLTGIGGAAAGAVTGAASTASAAAGNATEKVGDAAEAVGEKLSGAMGSVTSGFDGDGTDDGGSILRWLLPLILLALLLILGYWFCGTASTPVSKTHGKCIKSIH